MENTEQEVPAISHDFPKEFWKSDNFTTARMEFLQLAPYRTMKSYAIYFNHKTHTAERVHLSHIAPYQLSKLSILERMEHRAMYHLKFLQGEIRTLRMERDGITEEDIAQTAYDL